MDKAARVFFLLLLIFPAILPAAHPEARLFSDGWGASSFIDPDLCMTQLPDQPNRLAVREMQPMSAHWSDRLVLLLQYLLWGIALPVVALAALLAPWLVPSSGRAFLLPGIPHRAALPTPVTLILLFGLLGMSSAYFQWTLNPAYVDLRQGLAEVWLEHWSMAESQFVWLDALALSIWLVAGAVLLGGSCLAATWWAARLVQLDWRRLARDLMPLAGVVLFLCLTKTTALYLRGEGVPLQWLPGFRVALLAMALAWSGWMGWRTLLRLGAGSAARKAAAALLWLLPVALLTAHCWAMLFHWTNRYHV